MKLLTRNKKIQKTSKLVGERVFNFSLPALKTCPNAGECRKGCYANAGAFLFSTVRSKHESNLKATMNQATFIKQVISEIDSNRIQAVRIHDSGDFGLRGRFRPKYFEAWLEVAFHRPNVLFYAYTKHVSDVKEYRALGLLPNNIKFIFSFGGTEDQLINTESERHSVVFDSYESMLKAGYTDCTKNDLNALKTLKVGLIYHGQKSLDKTKWSEVPMLRHLKNR